MSRNIADRIRERRPAEVVGAIALNTGTACVAIGQQDCRLLELAARE
jgi:hypothetical protein